MTLQIHLNADASEPPYEQIRSQVVHGIVAGRYPDGLRLPTVRALAAELGIAVNTAAKAYRALEAEGHIETRGRHGSFIRAAGSAALADHVEGTVAARAEPLPGGGVRFSDADPLPHVPTASVHHQLSEATAALVAQARSAGLSFDEMVGLARRAWVE